jgi:hypothetical protein
MEQPQYNRIAVDNDIEDYDRITEEWNISNEVQERREHRNQLINNTDGYRNGNRIHHILSIQMYSSDDWNALFGHEILNHELREYAEASIEWAQDEMLTHRFAGQMVVSMLMQENYRPGVHLAIFIIHLAPHRRFIDGHMIQKEFGEGSNIHQTINRLFDTNARAIVTQATQYAILEYLASDDEAMELLHMCFLDPEFMPRRYSYIELEQEDTTHGGGGHGGDGYYVVDMYANDSHRWHECYQQQELPQRHAHIIIPPPPPVIDFVAIYRMNYNLYNEEDGYTDDEDDYDEEVGRHHRENGNEYDYAGNDRHANIIQYHYNDVSNDEQGHGFTQG